ncbi:Gfo/Idh/MocA family oxidoreductase [Chloroflexi bacterium CFX2]|nr:Gfo/Idh/MocA family oxidoreductase [Chloroflexi bacterium CFX2]
MTNKILNWGLLSTARINRALIPPLQVSKRNKLLAVASRSQEADVIYNPLPNHLHAEWTVKAVEAGKHVLCEKPLALSVDEVDAIKSAAQKHGRVVAEAFMYRHHPQTLKVQEIVKSGSLGTLRLMRGSFSFVLSRAGDVRLNPEWGGGSLWDVGCYPISYARAVVGEEPLEAFGWQVTGRTGIDETFVGQMRFGGDVLAQFDNSFVIPFHAFMEIVGSEGTLNIPRPFKPGVNEKIYLTRGDKTETITIKGQELYIGEVEDMADAILLGRAPRVSLEDSRANVAAICAFLESARTGRPILLEH